VAIGVRHRGAAARIGSQAAVDAVIVGVIGDDEDVSLGLGGAVEKQGYNGDYGEHATHGSPTHAIGNCNESVCRLGH